MERNQPINLLDTVLVPLVAVIFVAYKLAPTDLANLLERAGLLVP